jgi:hypothetical protein
MATRSATNQYQQALPVVRAPKYGNFVMDGSPVELTVPAGCSIAVVEAIAGAGYISGGDTATPQSYSAPSADVTNGSFVFTRVESSGSFARREFFASAGAKFLITPDDSNARLAVYFV